MRFVGIVIILLTAMPSQHQRHSNVKLDAAVGETPSSFDHFDIGRLDKSVDPCTDVYQYSCGKWMAANPIPAQEVAWGTVSKLLRWNEEALHEILEQSSRKDHPSPIEQKIGDYYAACMDEKAVNWRGLAALAPELQRIHAIKKKSELAQELAHLHRQTFAMWEQPLPGYHTAIFWFASGQDLNDGRQVVAIVDQAGLGLPDRDYYFRTDPQSGHTRRDYVEHLKKMFVYMGERLEGAATDANLVMNIETAMAKASMDLVRRRNPANLNHRMSLQQLQALTPSFRWKEYLTALGAPAPAHYLVYTPEFFKNLEILLAHHPLKHWKAYLRARLVDTVSPLMSQLFLNENFNFYNRRLQGQVQIEPRWRRCVRYTDRDLGEALGQLYVSIHFSPGSRQAVLHLVAGLKEALNRDIEQLDWMTLGTKKAAQVKLNAIEDNIGYPDHWRNYTGLVISRDAALENAFRASEFELLRQLAKIGQPVDRGEWVMTAPTTNAYYDTHLNSINFPAGILQSAFFDPNLDDAVNYGAIGAVIGHEITHGFDDRGSKFDANGNLREWWAPQDAERFKRRTQCFDDEYSKFVATADVHLNGKLTLGENAADNGGLRIALSALRSTAVQKGKISERRDGLTSEQRFFISFSQMWCENDTPEYLRYLAQADQHSPAKYRVNGAVSNMSEFQQAFHCRPGQPMARNNACRVW